VTGCGSTKHAPPRLLVPWQSVGDIKLGEPLKQVRAEYGREGPYGYRLYGGMVDVESNFDTSGRVTWIYVTSRYYRTTSGFGVGSRFPTAWRRSFIWNPTLKVDPCSCWVKVGTGKRSLPLPARFGIPWVIVDVAHGRVTSILLSSKYVD